MATCPACGASYSDGTRYCVLDGTPLSGPPASGGPGPFADWPRAALASVAALTVALVGLLAVVTLRPGPAEVPPSPPEAPSAPAPAFQLPEATPPAERPVRALPPDGSGEWLVILGSFTDFQDADVAARLWTLDQQGVEARVDRSSDYPNLVPGLRITVLGPYSQPAARGVAEDLRPVVPDVYIKSGW